MRSKLYYTYPHHSFFHYCAYYSFLLYYCSFTRNCASGIVSLCVKACQRLWLRVCPGYFRVWVVIGFSLFLDPGRNKNDQRQTGKGEEFPEAHTYDNTCLQSLSVNIYTSSCALFKFVSHIPVSIVDEWEHTGDIYQRYSGGEQILACFLSLSTRGDFQWQGGGGRICQ